MRSIPLLLIGAAVASCSTAPPQPMRSAQGQQQYEALLAGKVAGKPINCLPSYRAKDMVRIDDETIAFRDGARVYVAHMRGPCTNLTSSPYALVTKSFTSFGLCNGDIARVVDTASNVTVGSCAFGDFIPYARPGVRT